MVLNDPRYTQCMHDQHKYVWNGKTRIIVEGEVEISKMSKRIPMQIVRIIESLDDEAIRFVSTY
jgi:hypothetical protein